MIPTKDDLRINDSYYFKSVFSKDNTSEYLIKRDDLTDPGRISMNVGFPHKTWTVVMRYNKVVDPFEDMNMNRTLVIPTQNDFNSSFGLF